MRSDLKAQLKRIAEQEGRSVAQPVAVSERGAIEFTLSNLWKEHVSPGGGTTVVRF
jgi:hypothetical protein